MTVGAGGVHNTVSLDSVLLQAADNNPQVASQLYAHLLKAVSHSSSIKPAPRNSSGGGGGGGAGGGRIGSGGHLHQYAVPYNFNDDPLCKVIPNFVTCPVQIGSWKYYFKWPILGQNDSSFGPPPAEPEGHTLIGNCDPQDVQCQIFNNNRINACNALSGDSVEMFAAVGGGAFGCFTSGAFTGGFTCFVAITAIYVTTIQRIHDEQTCVTPYPGTQG